MSEKLVKELYELKDKNVTILEKGRNVEEDLKKAICGSNTKYCGTGRKN